MCVTVQTIQRATGRAEVELSAASHAVGKGTLTEAASDRVRRADAAVQRAAQPDLIAEIDSLRSALAVLAKDNDEAIARAEAALAGMAARDRLKMQLVLELGLVDLRLRRGRPADIASAPKQLEDMLARAVQRLGGDALIVHSIEQSIANSELAHGKVAAAHARAARIRRILPQDKPRRIAGTVLDERGAPVAGVTVIVGKGLVGTSVSVASFGDGTWRVVQTGTDGSFEIADAPERGVVVAELGNRRAPPVAISDRVELRLATTSRLEGKVELGAELPSSVGVAILDPEADEVAYVLVAPVEADGDSRHLPVQRA